MAGLVESTISLEHFPPEILEKIVYGCASAVDFLSLSRVSKELNNILNMTNYPGMVNYLNIRNIKNKARFKSITTEYLIDDNDIQPTLLVIDNKKPTDKIMKIPMSVITLYVTGCTICMDSERNNIMENLYIGFCKIIGCVPKNITRLVCDSPLYGFDGVFNLVTFTLRSYIAREGKWEEDLREINKILVSNKKITEISLDFNSLTERITYTLPKMDSLKNIDIAINTREITTIDLINIEKLDILRIITVSELNIVNPPKKIKKYIFEGAWGPKLYGQSTNISAEIVELENKLDIYTCDNQVKSITLVHCGGFNLSNSVIHARVINTGRTVMRNTCNLETLDMKSSDIVVNIDSIKNLTLLCDKATLNGEGTMLENIIIAAKVVVGDIKKSKVKKICKDKNMNFDDFILPDGCIICACRDP